MKIVINRCYGGFGLQSHLVKEVEKQEMPGYQDEGGEHAHAGYVRALEDIINIINNLTK